jgi:hypothetical protein
MSHHPRRDAVNHLAKILMEAWAKAEPSHGVTLHPTSYIATFADMARAVVDAGYLRQPLACEAVR